MMCFAQGDKNSKFFHSYVEGKRGMLHLAEIEDTQGQMLTEEATIGKEAV